MNKRMAKKYIGFYNKMDGVCGYEGVSTNHPWWARRRRHFNAMRTGLGRIPLHIGSKVYAQYSGRNPADFREWQKKQQRPLLLQYEPWKASYYKGACEHRARTRRRVRSQIAKRRHPVTCPYARQELFTALLGVWETRMPEAEQRAVLHKAALAFCKAARFAHSPVRDRFVTEAINAVLNTYVSSGGHHASQ